AAGPDDHGRQAPRPARAPRPGAPPPLGPEVLPRLQAPEPTDALLPAVDREPLRVRLADLGAGRVPHPRSPSGARGHRGEGDPGGLRPAGGGQPLPDGPRDGPDVRRHRDLSRDTGPVPRGVPRSAGGSRVRAHQSWLAGEPLRRGVLVPLHAPEPARPPAEDPPRRATVEAGARGELRRPLLRRDRARGATASRPAHASGPRRGAARPAPSASGALPRARTRGGPAGDRSPVERSGTRGAPSSS